MAWDVRCRNDLIGASIDVVIDGWVVDLKTAIRPRLNPLWLYQILGYALLEPVNVVSTAGVGFYLTRQGVFVGWSLPSLIEAVTGVKGATIDPVEAADVLLMGLEDGKRRLKRRLQHWIGEGPVPRMTIATGWPRANVGGIERIEEWLKDHPQAGLVIIDHLELFRPIVEGKNGKRAFSLDYEAARPLTELATEHRVAIVLVHHLNQLTQVDDPMQLLSGTEGLPAGTDTAWILQKKRGSRDAELHVSGRDLPSQELALNFDEQMLIWRVLGAATPRYTAVESETLEVIERLKGCTGKQLAAELNLEEVTARKRLHDMLNRELVIQPQGRGKYFINTGNVGNISNVEAHEKRTNVTDVTDVTPFIEQATCAVCSGLLRELSAGGYKCDACDEVVAWPGWSA